MTPPTLEMVSSYCILRRNSVDAEHFCDYYEAQGWLLSNGRKMKNWQAAVRLWERKGFTQPATWIQGPCKKHPGSGLTVTGRCWECYAESCQPRGAGTS